MMSALSDVFERSSQERTSDDTARRLSDETAFSGERRSAERPSSERPRPSFESRTSSSDHGLEMREIRIVEPPEEVRDIVERSASAEHRQQKAALFAEYRNRVERLDKPRGGGRGPASSSQAARSAFADAAGPSTTTPRDSHELRRSVRFKSSLRPSMEQSMASAVSIPAGEDPAAFVVQAALDKAAQENAARKSFQAPTLGQRLTSVPPRVRISIDPDGDTNLPRGSAIQSVNATLVKRRRRLPWKLLLGFGIVSCLCLIVALTTLSIGIYNFTKLRASRAARTIDQLRNEIEPQLTEMLSILRNMTRR